MLSSDHITQALCHWRKLLWQTEFLADSLTRPTTGIKIAARIPETETRIAIADRYEAPVVVKQGDYWYLFVSATACCRGPLTGYGVFAGRAEHPLGPYLDRDGASFLDGRVGGNVVLSMNGNRWVGPGHNDIFTDAAGQDWFVYHAIDRKEPYFAGATGFTKRPLMLDPLDWIDGWPVVRGGQGPFG